MTPLVIPDEEEEEKSSDSKDAALERARGGEEPLSHKEI